MQIDEKDFKEKLELAKQGIGTDLVEAFADACPQDSGFLMGNITYRITDEGDIEFSFPFYAEYLEFGTGLYGPYRQVIRPKNKKALAWGKTIGRTKEGVDKKEFVFAYVEGITPRPFIRPVLHQKMMDIMIKNLNRYMRDIKINL